MPDGHTSFGLIEKTDDLFLGTSALIHFRHAPSVMAFFRILIGKA
jgi:hypothetical protein